MVNMITLVSYQGYVITLNPRGYNPTLIGTGEPTYYPWTVDRVHTAYAKAWNLPSKFSTNEHGIPNKAYAEVHYQGRVIDVEDWESEVITPGTSIEFKRVPNPLYVLDQTPLSLREKFKQWIWLRLGL